VSIVVFHFWFDHAQLVGTKHLVAGGKKCSGYVASLFVPWFTALDPKSTRIDSVFFDGASNVQKAGRLLQAQFPRVHVQHCAAHSVSLFFSDLCKKLWEVRLLLVNYQRVYRMFGSGSMHSPYALFIQQSKNFNAGRKVGLIRAADTRMAGHIYAQCRLLRLREPLLATIASAAFKDLKLKKKAEKVESFLSNPEMWKAVYVLLRCLYPMLRVLRLADQSECGGMSKILYYVHKTDEAIEKSMNALESMKYFDDHQEDDAVEDDSDEEVDGDDDASDDEVDIQKNDNDDDEEEGQILSAKHLGEQISALWDHRRIKLITPLAIAGWYCSPSEEIRKDVIKMETGANRLDVERCIGMIFYPIHDDELGKTIDTFWREFDDFQTKRGPSYSRSWIWGAKVLDEGKDHLWHKLYSVPFTTVFGLVACRVCSKPLGCGNAERNWGAFKHLKTGKRSHLLGDKAKKQATVFGAASIDRVRAVHRAEEASGVILEKRWTDADMTLDLGLERWDGGFGEMPAVVVPKRIFKAWIEDWEYECIHDRDGVAKQRLLHKYGGLQWLDEDRELALCIADDKDMDYQGAQNGEGWCVIEHREDGTWESWELDCVIDEIAEYQQPAELNVEVIFNEELREANRERQRVRDELKNQKKASKASKKKQRRK
jgi:hypothetical protein